MKAPDWVKFIASDRDGATWFYQNQPKWYPGAGTWDVDSGRCEIATEPPIPVAPCVCLHYPPQASDPKTGAGKPQLAHLPWQAMTPLARVMDFGASKYGRYSYLNSFTSSPREATMKYLDAGLRHIVEVIADPYAVDPETGELHATHAMACMTIVVAGLTAASSPDKVGT